MKTQDRPAARQSPISSKFAIIALLLVAGLWSAHGTDVSLTRLLTGLPEIGALLWRMFPPNPSILLDLLRPAIETLEMALIGTTLPIFIALPLALLTASNTTPHPAVAAAARVVAAFLRTVPDLIWAMLLVSAIGLGPFPGVLALTLHAIGGLTKFYYETIENAPHASQEAMIALGARKPQIILFAILPNVLPELISSTLLYWEYNNRASTVLGLVGAGGIGLVLTQAIQEFRYQDAMTCLLVIIVILVAIDLISAKLRGKVI
ncbi:MAG TPA: phosphonate ABC transporter, permease protein PhnE [Beijerinckiaceae bacterium]|nr:phosphonate ABC transporter, permease protein PhnE [Beijerinckiaceae bacterium]